MTSAVLAILTQAAFDDCALTGLCAVVQPARPVASGVMFLATGLVLGGLLGLRRSPRRS